MDAPHDDSEVQAVKLTDNHTALQLLRKLKGTERHRDDQAILRRSLERSRDYMRSIWHPDNNQAGCRADFSIIWALYEIMFDIFKQTDVIVNETQFFRLISVFHTDRDHQPEKLGEAVREDQSHEVLMSNVMKSEARQDAIEVMKKVQKMFK